MLPGDTVVASIAGLGSVTAVLDVEQEAAA
jgi:hypothetical protein